MRRWISDGKESFDDTHTGGGSCRYSCGRCHLFDRVPHDLPRCGEGRALPVDVKDGAILHAGPIIRKHGEGSYEMVTVGPTTSMRMEKFEEAFIAKTGVRLIIGKGGMKDGTVRGCHTHKALHCVFPAGCAVVAAACVEEITAAHWLDLGMPETLWTCKVHEFGPLIVSIDAHGRNLFEENKVIFNERKEKVCTEISKQVGFIR